MERMLAWLFLASASVLALLGNFWFTYGIWPRSWWSFAAFALIFILLSEARAEMFRRDKDGK